MGVPPNISQNMFRIILASMVMLSVQAGINVKCSCGDTDASVIDLSGCCTDLEPPVKGIQNYANLRKCYDENVMKIVNHVIKCTHYISLMEGQELVFKCDDLVYEVSVDKS